MDSNILNPNQDIKSLIKKAGLKQYQVATALGVNALYFSSKLSQPLSKQFRAKVLNAIKQLKELKEEAGK